MSMKNPLTLAGIEPANFRFVAQHFNHCATAVINGCGGKFNWQDECKLTVFVALFGEQKYFDTLALIVAIACY